METYLKPKKEHLQRLSNEIDLVIEKYNLKTYEEFKKVVSLRQLAINFNAAYTTVVRFVLKRFIVEKKPDATVEYKDNEKLF